MGATTPALLHPLYREVDEDDVSSDDVEDELEHVDVAEHLFALKRVDETHWYICTFLYM